MTFGFPMISAASARLIFLTVASALLLAAGDASTTGADRFAAAADDGILAPLSPAEASAARDALAASLPADTAASPAIIPEAAPVAASLSRLVGAMSPADAGDSDMRCLATAVYFESRGEPLEGQLAVAQAILNRVESGRYADSVCNVINQPGQFSFSRNRAPAGGGDWRTAQAIARIAADNMWREVAPRANSFHAARLSPGWRDKVRVAQIGNHIFYR
jgi:N-acetylmuramoyl-L-alanine amidase